MYPFSIGVILDSFRTDLTTALDKAAAVGATGARCMPRAALFPPMSLSPQKRREFLDMCKSLGADHLRAVRRFGPGLCQPGEESRTHRAIQAHSGFGQGFGD